MMHDGDKIPRSAIGHLLRSKDKVSVNPFPEGVALMKKAHATVVFYNKSGARWDKLRLALVAISSRMALLKKCRVVYVSLSCFRMP